MAFCCRSYSLRDGISTGAFANRLAPSPAAVVAKVHVAYRSGYQRFSRVRPRVAVTVQRHAFDAQPFATLFKLRGPIARTNRSQAREQGPLPGKSRRISAMSASMRMMAMVPVFIRL